MANIIQPAIAARVSTKAQPASAVRTSKANAGAKASTDAGFDTAMSRAQDKASDAQSASSAANPRDGKSISDAKAAQGTRDAKENKDVTDTKNAVEQDAPDEKPMAEQDGAENVLAAEAAAAAAVQSAGDAKATAQSESVEEASVQDAQAPQASLQSLAPQGSLQSLVPQDAAQQAKSSDLLAMLSGHQLKQSVQQEEGTHLLQGMQLAANGTAAQTAKSQKAATPLEAGLAGSGTDVQTLAQIMPHAGNAIRMTRDPQESGADVARAQQNAAIATETTQAQPALSVAAGASVQQDATQLTQTAVQAATPLQAAQQDAAQQVTAQHAAQNAPQGEQEQTPQGGEQDSRSAEQQGKGEARTHELQGIRTVQSTDAQPVQMPHAAGTAAAQSAFQQTLHETIAGTGQTANPTQPQTDYDIPRQIVDQARLIRHATDTEMVIKLKPEHLGELTLKISVTESGAVNASFHSPHAEVRTAIENSLVQLRQDLNNQGIKVDSVEVFSGMGSELPQGQGQQAYQNQQGHAGGGAQGSLGMDAESYADEADALAAAGSQAASTEDAQGVDYRI